MKVLLEQERKRLGLTQKKLADKTGIARTTIGDIEKGRHVSAIKNALILARALNLRVEDIFVLKGDEAK